MIRNTLLLTLLCLSLSAHAQYSETFSTPEKGYLMNFVDDFSGLNWTLSPWDQGTGLRDASDYCVTTAAGKLESIDLDQELCWESPLLNTTPSLTVSFQIDLSWVGFDSDIQANSCATEYIRVFYSVNGGAYVMVPNVAGGNACATVAYPFESPGMQYDGSVKLDKQGVQGGSTLKLKVCVVTNANAEIVTIDNVTVPEMGVTVMGGLGITDYSVEPDVRIYPNPAIEAIRINFPHSRPGNIRVVSVTGEIMTEIPVLGEDLQIDLVNWPSGIYFLQHLESGHNWTAKRFMVLPAK
ncbi:MAG: T9SS type A sorting domain-containing protein [Saprospiraceae bacterium]